MSPAKKPQLTLVKPTESPNWNVLLYGPPKVGKTMGATTAPAPLLHVNADRPNATRLAHKHHDFDEVAFEGLETMVAVINAVDKGHYRTVVIDPIGEVYTKLIDTLSGHALRPQIQIRGDAGTHLERWIRALCDKPVNVVFVAHEMPVFEGEDENPERIPLMTSKSGSPVFAAKVMATVDVIGYVGRVVEKEDGKDVTKYVAQLSDGRGRRGGTRWPELGTSRELDLSEWESKLNEQAPEKPEADTKGADAA